MKKMTALFSVIIILFTISSCLNRNPKAERAENTQEGVHKQILDSREQEDKWQGEGVRKITDSTKKELDTLRKDSIDRNLKQ